MAFFQVACQAGYDNVVALAGCCIIFFCMTQCEGCFHDVLLNLLLAALFLSFCLNPVSGHHFARTCAPSIPLNALNASPLFTCLDCLFPHLSPQGNGCPSAHLSRTTGPTLSTSCQGHWVPRDCRQPEGLGRGCIVLTLFFSSSLILA
jgi:hypothetical protein